jgi:putative ABC transport system substrate-binding protein
MRRRQFIAGLGGAIAWPDAAWAQQPPMPVVGFLSSGGPQESGSIRLTPFLQGLREAGYVEGRNVAIEYRWAEEQYDRLPALATDLVLRRVSVIVTVSNRPAASAAKAATTTIPIVFVVGIDPVEAGLVASLNRPGGNVTGMTLFSVELGQKRLQILHEMVPAETTFALLVNPANPLGEIESRNLQTAARTLGLQLQVLHARTERDFDTIFAALAPLRVGGLVIGGDALFVSRRTQLASLATDHAIPVIHQLREFVAAGGLMSYGAAAKDSFRSAGVYAGRILKGDKPAELPVQQATKVELIINLKTAKKLGITIPISLLGRADEVIE